MWGGENRSHCFDVKKCNLWEILSLSRCSTLLQNYKHSDDNDCSGSDLRREGEVHRKLSGSGKTISGSSRHNIFSGHVCFSLVCLFVQLVREQKQNCQNDGLTSQLAWIEEVDHLVGRVLFLWPPPLTCLASPPHLCPWLFSGLVLRSCRYTGWFWALFSALDTTWPPCV